jgi:hypothetical protein
VTGFSWNHPSWYLPWFYLSIIWTFLFLPSWLAKDRSASVVSASAESSLHLNYLE